MQEFTLERKIPPTEVTLDLLRQLEKVLVEDLRKGLPAFACEAAPKFQIAITDSFGTEIIGSIGDYRPLLLPDTTKSVVVRFRTAYQAPSSMEINIAFTIDQYFSKYSVDVKDSSAREVAIGFSEKVRQVLAPQRRGHAFLHAGGLGVAVAGLVAVFGFSFLMAGFSVESGGIMDKSAAKQVSIGMGGGLLSLVALYVLAGQVLRPYIIFDSQQNRGRTMVWNWLIFGGLTFIVFTTVAFSFRKSLLGF